MSSAESLARPYARAAFDLAREANALNEWSKKLEFAAAVASDPQVRQLIGNPGVTGEQLVGLLLPQGEKTDSAYANFLGTLAANRRLPILVDVAQGFAVLKRESEGVLKVRVRAAVPVDAAMAETLKAALTKRFGRQIELESEIDESVIGGAIIDAGDVVIDGSVRGRLERLAQNLTH
ncbi:F0F1 ATP synthase subunit delta [Tahibacter amnicola]|uniref:ATP synthase subunit delta n=1 Tax=Tahibacter amnicola TaxID=2976241 RepID=A0ABY6BI21_9GAMM|nr:F0F1 ATP synthase subunit delta [Tahibacter amnicola]UXI68735.1 F0F1 ATP synthase subunit delta [Tahibacter amnicola]